MSNDHFLIEGDAISPQPWMQQRLVATGEQPSVSRDYDTSGGSNKNDLVHTVSAKWTNNTPIPQWVYGLVTRGGLSVALQARSRAYLAAYHALDVTATPTAPTTFDYVEVSRSGCGLDAGRGGLLSAGSGFAIQEKRENSNTTPLMPHLPNWQRVEPGETIHARVGVRFVSQFWENTTIDRGDSSTHSGFISGGTRLDLWAVPIIVDPGPRPVPSIVGVNTARAFSADTSVAKVTGVATGDTILAFVMSQWGSDSDMTPNQAGWQLIHRPGRTEGLRGLNDVHLRVYRRIAGASEPATYSFNNGFLAEQIVIMMVLRDVSDALEDGWFMASTVRKYSWERDDGHICPPIDRRGQRLFALSYIAHATGQSPIVQQHPEGMTEVVEYSGGASTVSLATLASPPRPTRERLFVPDKKPVWSGRSISFTLLVSGEQP